MPWVDDEPQPDRSLASLATATASASSPAPIRPPEYKVEQSC